MSDCEQISSCPFCGSKETHLLDAKTAFSKPIDEHFHVACTGCAAFGPLRTLKGHAIDSWNKLSFIVGEYNKLTSLVGQEKED